MALSNDFWLFTRPIAHRGLWGGEIIENSLTAYKAAMDNGYPIEIDLFLTRDNEIVCFHDDNLYRMTGKDSKIYHNTLATLKSLPLKGTAERIPTLQEVLSLIDGKVPLLIEIKDQPNDFIVDKTVEILKNYGGEFAVQSFNPFYINRVKRLAPDFVCGILGTHEKERLSLPPFVKNIIFENFIPEK